MGQRIYFPKEEQDGAHYELKICLSNKPREAVGYSDFTTAEGRSVPLSRCKITVTHGFSGLIA